MNNKDIKSKNKKLDHAWKPLIFNLTIFTLVLIIGIFLGVWARDKQLVEKVNTYLIIVPVGFILVCLLAVGYLSIHRLKKDLSQAQEKVEAMTITDEFTKIYNRKYFLTKIDEEFQRAKRYGRPLCCIMMDIDYFKNLNDTYGHYFGDSILEQVAGILKTNCRTSDTVARYWGEEFIILLPEVGQEGAAVTAEKIRLLVEQAEISTTAGTPIPITASLGAAYFSPTHLKKESDYQQLIKAADAALYLAKLNGRNRVEIFES
ncbi:MAG TPA: GGDEF domain-containing protein [Candidatus Deferrimicrobium sp.]|nr:GGDEF domain-containing protein [Candidatus Kapabacteria bacterium]HLP60905.1 GGDEF domain-containing protein [Candidatus Deferrimicrobium sp.]